MWIGTFCLLVSLKNMKYITLLRGVNVGGNRKIEMGRLKAVFQSLGFSGVTTYINSGNIIFEASTQPDQKKIEVAMEKEFGFSTQLLIKTESEMQAIANAIPKSWQNDTFQRTDVAYLFDAIDYKKIIDELPIKKEFVDIRSVPGAIFWNVKRKDYYKSHLSRLIAHALYKFMTVRNVNTARRLGGIIRIDNGPC